MSGFPRTAWHCASCGNTQGLGPVLARRYHANRKRGAGQQPASLRWLRYPVGSTNRGRTRDHRHRAEGIESDPQHEHLRSRRFVRSNHCGHERGHARQYRRVVVTHARLAGSQSASRAWLWPTAVVASRLTRGEFKYRRRSILRSRPSRIIERERSAVPLTP
jgi:hypothetical protein